MKKYFATLLAAVSLLTVSCSKDDDPTTGSSDAGVYRKTIEVSGNDEFTASASYVTEGKVKEIAAQGMVHSNEKASVRMKVTKDGKTVFDESKSIDPETGTGKIGELRFTTISQ